MSKKRPASDSSQLSLLDLIQRAKEMEETPSTQGQVNVERELRLAMGEAVKHCPLSIHQIAGEMSHLLGETVTADMIYSWTSESKTKHQVWGSRLPAFCRVTGSRRPMEILVQASGMYCLPGPEALRSEIQRLREEEQKAAKERRKREMFLQELEGGRQ
jgi:hypothetical protein